jgi:predicted membrane protein
MYASNITTTGSTIITKDIAGWILIYVAISIGIALLGSLIIGALIKCLSRKKLRYFDDSELFKSGNYGLRGNVDS